MSDEVPKNNAASTPVPTQPRPCDNPDAAAREILGTLSPDGEDVEIEGLDAALEALDAAARGQEASESLAEEIERRARELFANPLWEHTGEDSQALRGALATTVSLLRFKAAQFSHFENEVSPNPDAED